MKPPKCRNCGVEEWRHVCAGAVPAPSRVTLEVVKGTAPRAKTAAVRSSTLKHEMRALGRRGGLVGGAVRAARLSPERRREIAQAAARARWAQ